MTAVIFCVARTEDTIEAKGPSASQCMAEVRITVITVIIAVTMWITYPLGTAVEREEEKGHSA